MTFARVPLLCAMLVLASCGGSGIVECDSGPYQVAVRTPKVQAPEGLDNLNPLDEMPLPEASPRDPRPEDGSCLEQPPQTIRLE